METNPELELAFRYLTYTDRHLFLTGKAGTGKTTFLHRVRAELPKRMAVVAPTGVAAINARGVTIHSLFQLPFGTLLPERMKSEVTKRRFSRKKQDLIRSLDLLIIDEISMVRADLLDAIDAVLRYVRRSSEPFGGVQLLMIGDLHQLPPVVKDSDWYELRDVYATSYFFASLALRQAGAQVIQLTHIYRQQDDTFIGLLNKVRNNRMDQAVLDQLNARYVPDFRPDDEEGYITLASHNRASRAINEEKLERLSTPGHTFAAAVEGTFPESMYPNEAELTFKVGAQVMFNKNDTGEARAYFNGKIGTITAIDRDEITVRCTDGAVIEVLPVTWENRKYELNKNKEVEEDVIGTYEQHPLRLAWAITIHKSQGLTFDRVIIDAGAAFAHGQVYVALSRCRTFEGIVLRTRIHDSSVKTDEVVSSYSAHAAAHAPSDQSLRADRRAFELRSLRELFDFTDAGHAARRLHRALFEHERSVQGAGHADFQLMWDDLNAKAIAVGAGFRGHIDRYGRDAALPSEHPELTGRLRKASAYFQQYLGETYLPNLAVFGVMTDNKSVKQLVEERRVELARQLFRKLRGFATLAEGFDPAAYVTARTNADLDFDKQQQATAKSQAAKPKVILPKDLKHPELYVRLADWRAALAAATEVPAYTIAHNNTLLEIAALLPTEKASLLRVNGIGPKRYADYGAALLEIVRDYLDGRTEQQTDLFAVAKADTRRVTLELFREGKSIPAIARLRELTDGTIMSHLNHWVKSGELAAGEVIAEEALAEIAPYLRQHPDLSLTDYRNHFDERYSYDTIRLVRSSLG